MFNRDSHSYVLPSVTFQVMLLEIAVILICTYVFTGFIANRSPHMEISGVEFAAETSDGELSSIILKQTGRLPLWNSFWGNGQPMFEDIFSYTLNPLMSIPVLIWGAVQGGKFALLLHIMLAGLGGWALARVLGFNWAARILLGLLLAGSGSMATPIGDGFYEIGISQAYIPWIMVGVIGTLYLTPRWPVALLVVSTALMIFSGSFWYLLTCIISAALLVLFAVISWDREHRRFSADRRMLQRLAWAGVFTLLVTAVRTLPLYKTALFFHPVDPLDSVFSFSTTFGFYFTSQADFGSGPMRYHYHYILPLAFAIFLLAAYIALRVFWRDQKRVWFSWRIIIPALLMVVGFTFWSQEGTPLMRWLYQNTFLGTWRYPGRIAAAASPWIAVFAALCFDKIVRFLTQAFLDQNNGSWLRFRKFQLRVPPALAQLCLLVILVLGLVSATDVLKNWSRATKVIPTFNGLGEVEGLRYLRQQHPTEMLPVLTQSLITHFGFTETLIRSSTGYPWIFANGLISTIGIKSEMDFLPEYAVGINHDFQDYLTQNGYEPDTNAPTVNDQPSVWHNPNVPPYAFTVLRHTLIPRTDDLTRADVQPVDSYTHRIDSIELAVHDYSPDSVLVVSEADFPGWLVTVNGNPAVVESVGRYLGVILPDLPNGEVVDVVFTYQPIILYIGAWISLLSILIFSLFTLHADEYFTARFPITDQKIRHRIAQTLNREG